MVSVGLLTIGFLSSCHDEDFDVSTTVLKERAFEHAFVNEFGQPSAEQRWDFYAQKMERLCSGEVAATRATGDTHVYNGLTLTEDANGVAVISNDPRVEYTNRRTFTTYWSYSYSSANPGTRNNTITYNPGATNSTHNSAVVQPELNAALLAEWAIALPEHDQSGHNADNTGKGTTGFTLKSPKSGLFTVSAVMFQGMWTRLAYMQEFIFGIEVNGKRYPLFGGGGLYDGKIKEIVRDSWETTTITSTHRISDVGYDWEYYSNPNWASYIYITPGTTFNFYFTYVDGIGGTSSETSYAFDSADEGRAMLLYNAETDNQRIMMIGFEDCKETGNSQQKDINDFVIYVSGDLPEPTSKLFFCEDLNDFDFDYNDVVVRASTTGLTLVAVGGTLPVYMQYKGKADEDWTTTPELHEYLASLQTASEMIAKRNNITYYPDENDKTKKAYRPINVGDDKIGIKLDPQKFVVWTESNGNRLDPEYLPDGTPVPGDPLADWKDNRIFVADEYGGSYTEQTVIKDFTIVPYDQVSTHPAIIEVPNSVSYMKERVRIDKGYPTFYTGNGEGEDNQWYNYNKVVGNLYNFQSSDDKY